MRSARENILAETLKREEAMTVMLADIQKNLDEAHKVFDLYDKRFAELEEQNRIMREALEDVLDWDKTEDIYNVVTVALAKCTPTKTSTDDQDEGTKRQNEAAKSKFILSGR